VTTLGHVLLWVGVLAASFVSVREAGSIAWPWFAGSLVIGLVGVVLLRVNARAAAGQRHRIAEDVATMRAALTGALAGVAPLRAAGESVEVYRVKDRLDSAVQPLLLRFADARASMIPAFGMMAYAEVMSRFAAGERILNRAWSASADGYLDEVVACLARGEAELTAAQALFLRFLEDRRAERGAAEGASRPA
jgi:hypothetical protein